MINKLDMLQVVHPIECFSNGRGNLDNLGNNKEI